MIAGGGLARAGLATQGDVIRNPAIVAALLATLFFACSATPAWAVADGGWAETNTDLTIFPDADPVETGMTNGEPLKLVKMPVTKRVNRVTLGDFRYDPTRCTGLQPVRLRIEYHDDGDPSGVPETTMFSGTTANVTGFNQKLVWDIPTTTFLEGRSYVFKVETVGGTCSFSRLRRTTWASSGPVYGGTAECAQSATEFTWYRAAHKLGLDTNPELDTNDGCGAYNFEETMPAGWLVVEPCGTTCRKIVTRDAISTPPGDCVVVATSQGEKRSGGRWKFWKQAPGDPSRNLYVCAWNQYADPGAAIDPPNSRGWHFATKWPPHYLGTQPERSGQPRDMFLSLQSIDYSALIQKHRPLLKYDLNETFFAADARGMIDAPGNKLIRRYEPEDPEFWDYAPIGNRVLATHESPSYLDETVINGGYPAGFPVPFPRADRDVLFSIGDPVEIASDLRDGGYEDHIFGRVAYGNDGKLWLQYWLWYYYNDFENGHPEPWGLGEHEGDWEMIQVGLNWNNEPDVVTYATHGSGQKCLFSTVADPSDADVPQVWVADGSHASYPRAGNSPLPWETTDHHWGDGRNLRPYAEVVTGEWGNFWGWPGHWGQNDSEHFSSPKAPREQEDKWTDPSQFHEDAGACDSLLEGARRAKRRRPEAQVDLPTPTFTASRTARHATVRYSVPARRFPRNAAVRVVVHSSDGSEPATSESRRFRKAAGKLKLLLPGGGGPYRVEVTLYDKRRRFGPSASKSLP